jgi:hypothetical protein
MEPDVENRVGKVEKYGSLYHRVARTCGDEHVRNSIRYLKLTFHQDPVVFLPMIPCIPGVFHRCQRSAVCGGGEGHFKQGNGAFGFNREMAKAP